LLCSKIDSGAIVRLQQLSAISCSVSNGLQTITLVGKMRDVVSSERRLRTLREPHVVFTAGIGEKSAEIRKRICQSSAWLGIELNAESNARGGPCISTPGSRVSVWVIPTNEELMIAWHTGVLLGLAAAHA
jgi:acetate kinase